MFYSWQNDAVKAIGSGSAILSAPTGSGKTWVAYVWAGLMDPSGAPAAPSGRVIFTAPIKALSNERYMELRSMGFDAGLETGDFKKNAGERPAQGNQSASFTASKNGFTRPASSARLKFTRVAMTPHHP